MNIWIISDGHWHHQKLTDWGDRPQSFTEILIENIKSMVSPEDTVLHLGDVIFGLDKEKKLTEIMKQLPGTWILIRGNHDEKDPDMYLRAGFKFICDEIVFGDVIFSHVPINITERSGLTLSVHGHFHNKTHRTADFPFWNPEQHKLFSLEQTDLKPVLLEEFIEKKIPRQKNKYHYSPLQEN